MRIFQSNIVRVFHFERKEMNIRKQKYNFQVKGENENGWVTYVMRTGRRLKNERNKNKFRSIKICITYRKKKQNSNNIDISHQLCCL